MSLRKTQLVQKEIDDPSESIRIFESTDGAQVPIVLIPKQRTCCSCTLTVPTGPLCIMQTWGKDTDENVLAPTGLTFSPGYEQIAYIVQRGAITYNAPVKSCPTADNVMVDCDLVLIFEIGPNAKQVRKFCYQLGARRFDEFLYAAVEEAIRQLIRTCLHTEVYELKGGQDKRVRSALGELNKKFNLFGVSFSSMAITDVKFKKELQDTLQEVTEYASKIKEEHKKQTHMMEHIEYEKNQRVHELQQVNQRYIQAAEAERTRVEIDREKQIIDCQSEDAIQQTKARQLATVSKVEAESRLATSTAAGQVHQHHEWAKIESEAARSKIEVEQHCKAIIFTANQKLVAAKATSEAMIIDAKAEEVAAASLKVMREHELRMAKMEVLQAMAANNKIVISGAQGDKLISELMHDSILGAVKLG